MANYNMIRPETSPSSEDRKRKREGGAVGAEQNSRSLPPVDATFHPRRAVCRPPSEPLELTSRQSAALSRAMDGVRKSEVDYQDDIRRRSAHRRRRTTSEVEGDSSSCLLDLLDAHPGAAQFVATSGGSITCWNDSFAELTGGSGGPSRHPLTIFDLVQAEYIGSLYGMFALALHGVAVVEDEEPAGDGEGLGSSHLTITLPCRKFCASCERNVTIIFVNEAPSRCFVGVVTSPLAADGASATVPAGRMVRERDDVLCGKLFDCPAGAV